MPDEREDGHFHIISGDICFFKTVCKFCENKFISSVKAGLGVRGGILLSPVILFTRKRYANLSRWDFA